MNFIKATGDWSAKCKIESSIIYETRYVVEPLGQISLFECHDHPPCPQSPSFRSSSRPSSLLAFKGPKSIWNEIVAQGFPFVVIVSQSLLPPFYNMQIIAPLLRPLPAPPTPLCLKLLFYSLPVSCRLTTCLIPGKHRQFKGE